MTSISDVESIYVDANVFIYLFDGTDETAHRANHILRSCIEKNIQIVSSALALAECLLQPIAQSNTQAVESFKRYFSSLRQTELNDEIVLHAAEIAVVKRLKIVDAIHVALAQQAGCGRFLTNDKKLASRTSNPKPLLFSDLEI